MRVSAKGKIERIGLVVAVIGVFIAAAAFINDMLSDRAKQESPASVTQSTSGNDSPTVANTKGTVTINGAPR